MKQRIRLMVGAALLAGSLLTTPTSAADAGSVSSVAQAARPKFQLPFQCGTAWQLNTWGHNPALDMVVKGNTGSRGKVVRASYAGVVRVAEWSAGAGNVIQIDHGNGWWTAYYHLLDSPTTYVKKGQRVNMWTQIGRVGKTGSNGGGWEHLHFEQRYTSNLDATRTSESHRVAAYFNTRRFTGAQTEWPAVVSHNCTAGRPTRFCQYRVKNTPWGSIAKRSWGGTKYDTEGRIADGTLVMAGLDGTLGAGAWRRLKMSGGSDNRGPWTSSTWLQYVGGSGCPV
jgi:hypothetical protein